MHCISKVNICFFIYTTIYVQLACILSRSVKCLKLVLSGEIDIGTVRNERVNDA